LDETIVSQTVQWMFSSQQLPVVLVRLLYKSINGVVKGEIKQGGTAAFHPEQSVKKIAKLYLVGITYLHPCYPVLLLCYSILPLDMGSMNFINS
jgi:hypothetical protein